MPAHKFPSMATNSNVYNDFRGTLFGEQGTIVTTRVIKNKIIWGTSINDCYSSPMLLW